MFFFPRAYGCFLCKQIQHLFLCNKCLKTKLLPKGRFLPSSFSLLTLFFLNISIKSVKINMKTLTSVLKNDCVFS